MNIKSILSSVFALALVAGFGVSQAAYASDHGDSSSSSSDSSSSSSDSSGYAAGDTCTCGSLTGTWVVSSSSDSSSSDSSSSDSSSSDS
ncbi:MAG: hypothetical protein R8M14_02080, partial [Ghiorsea sp.]